MILPAGFYAVLDLPSGVPSGRDPRELLELLVAGGAAVVQVRMKRACTRELVEVARWARERTRASAVPLVVNDRLDVALAVRADAVHLGQDDLPVAEARAAIRAAGWPLAIGVSTHSVAQARAAAAGADYLGFGPVYRTTTKDNPDPVQGVAALAEAVRAAGEVPVVAIGGVTPERAAEIAAAGARAACAISAVNAAADVVAAARRIAAAFAAP